MAKVMTEEEFVEEVTDKICSSCHKNMNGDFMTLSIHDNGKGIDSKDIENIFLPFFTTREREGGTGMGLSVLHGLLHDQQGHVLVDSIAGQYTEFKLLLAEEKLVIRDQEINQKVGRNIHIMIVDDEVPVGNVLAEILKHYDFEVTVETDSKQALINFNKHPDRYDLIITDKEMPNLTGIELAKLINDIKNNVPVILITGYGKDSVNENVESIKAILSKPFETMELIGNIRKLI